MTTAADDVDLGSAIEKLRVKYNVPRPLLDRMLNQESGGDDAAVSPVGARSRFQVMPSTFDLYNKQVGGVLKSDNPLDNAYVGLKLLSDNYKRFRPKAKSNQQAWAMSVAGYHGSPEAVERDLANGGDGIPDQGDGLINTRDHVYRIFSGLKPENFGDVSRSEVPKRPVVTSSIVEDFPELKPITFEADDATEAEKAAGLNIVARSARTIQESVALAGVDPTRTPDAIGKRVPLTFDHPPTPEEIGDAFLAQNGYGDVGQRFKQETGGLLAGIQGNTTPTKTADGHYVINLRPTRASIDVINAYAKNGMEGVKAILGEHQKQRINLHNEIVTAGENSGLKGDAKKILADQILAADQLFENINNLSTYGSSEYDPEWKSATAISEARNRLPPTRTTVGSVAEIPVGAAGTVGRVAMLGPLGPAAFPVEQALEHAHEGPEGATKAAILSLPMVAVGPIGKAIGTDVMAPLERQLVARGLGATAMAETAATQGASPKEILKEGLVGGMFPTGKRGIPERPIELGLKDVIHHSNFQPREAGGAFKEGKPNPEGWVVVNIDEVAQGAKPKLAYRPKGVPTRESVATQPDRRVAYLEGKLADMRAEGATLSNTPAERLAAISDTRKALAVARQEAASAPVEPLVREREKPFKTEDEASAYLDALNADDFKRYSDAYNAEPEPPSVSSGAWLDFVNQFAGRQPRAKAKPSQSEIRGRMGRTVVEKLRNDLAEDVTLTNSEQVELDRLRAPSPQVEAQNKNLGEAGKEQPGAQSNRKFGIEPFPQELSALAKDIGGKSYDAAKRAIVGKVGSVERGEKFDDDVADAVFQRLQRNVQVGAISSEADLPQGRDAKRLEGSAPRTVYRATEGETIRPGDYVAGSEHEAGFYTHGKNKVRSLIVPSSDLISVRGAIGGGEEFIYLPKGYKATLPKEHFKTFREFYDAVHSTKGEPIETPVVPKQNKDAADISGGGSLAAAPPSRETVQHASDISTAIESGNRTEANKILDELGVTNADIETALEGKGQTAPPVEPIGKGATVKTVEPPPRNDSEAERSFPKSLEEAGLPKGSDLYYNVKSHAETDAGAQRIIAERGEQQATLDVLQAQKLTPELVRTGQLLIRRLDDAGKTAEADALAESLSRKGTEYGQVIDAFSMVEARSPKEIANYVERQVQKTQPNFKMTPEDRASMEVLAKDFQKFKDESGQIIADLQSRVGKLESKPPSRLAVKAAGLQARLDTAAESARARLKERAEAAKVGTSQSGASGIPLDIADYAIIGAAKIAKGGLSIAQWTDEMASEFGDWVKDDFKRLYHESYKLYDNEKSADKTAQEARATEGMTPVEAKQKLRELSAARVNMRRARVEMQELYQTMNRTPGERLGAALVDAANAPRALMSSGDLSEALRQNSVFTLTEFKLAKQHAEKLFGSLSELKYQDLMSEIESSPEFLKVRDLMNVSFTSPELKRGHGLSSFDEYFPSQLAEKIPVIGAVVRASERAFTGPLDWARMTWGERFSKEIESYAAENDWTPEQTTKALQQAGKFINAATGRGEFSGKAAALNEYLPFLNTVFFSPRYQLSRLQLLNMSLNPFAIMRMESPVRNIVMRKMWRYYGTQAAIQVGMGAVGAQTNETDPNSPDWLKLKFGNTRYDLNAGLQQNMRILYTMSGAFAKLAAAEAQGNKRAIADAKQEVVGRGEYFLRSKLAPIPSFGVDYFSGSTINKQPFEWKTAAATRLVPLYLQDMYEGWKQENGIGGIAKGAAKSVPAIFGVGMQTYDDRGSHRPPSRPSQSSVPARPQ